jgi:hypothetical protein
LTINRSANGTVNAARNRGLHRAGFSAIWTSWHQFQHGATGLRRHTATAQQRTPWILLTK